MKNKLLISLLILSLTLLNGCQLAKTDIIATGQDRIIGCFVTTEYVDTFDFDKYITSNSSKLGKGGFTISDADFGYDKKIYGAMTKIPNPNSKYPYLQWDFNGLKGYYYFTPTIDFDGNIVRESCYSESLGDVHANFSYTDQGESSSLTATLYVSPTGKDLLFYVNPVYQSPDGSIYLLGGGGISAEGSSDEGPIMSTTLENKATTNFNEEIKSSSDEVTLSIEVKFPLKKSTILEMGKGNNLLAETPIDLDNIPKNFTPSKDTEYIILEGTKTDPNNKDYTSVEVYDKKKTTMAIYKDNGQNIMEKSTINLVWE